MFNKQDSDNNDQDQTMTKQVASAPQTPSSNPGTRTVNQILKGTSLTGDVNIDCDLELSGEVEGNITSDGDSNVIIKGICKGGISTKGGSVTIEGELKGGDIVAGSDVTISGRFGGGKVTAGGKIFINGEFNGVLEANEIELGAEARGAGRLLYREALSVARGATIEGEVARVPQEKPAAKSEEKASSKAEAASAGRTEAQRTIADTAKKPAQKVVAMQSGGREKDGAKEQTKASQSA